MKLIQSLEDDARGVQTYELPDGRRVRIDARSARKFGAANMLHSMGLIGDPSKMPRRPVYQGERQIGTVRGDFDPRSIRSRSVLYDPRPGDFVEDRDGWRASSSLGPGDIDAVVGFERS